MKLEEHTPDLTGASAPKVEARNKSSFYDPQKTEELLRAHPAPGVEIVEDAIRTRLDEALGEAYIEGCYRVKVDPKALLRTAQLNKELQDQLREARGQVQALLGTAQLNLELQGQLREARGQVQNLFTEIQKYLLGICDEWNHMATLRKYEPANIQVYEHVRLELRDLEELADRYGVVLQAIHWPKENPYLLPQENKP